MNRVTISEEEALPPQNAFSRRHPVLSYVFGDMVKGMYWVGCLALDLFLPAQLHLSFPGWDAVILPAATIVVIGLFYVELRFYRRYWPPPRRKPVAVIPAYRKER